MGQKVDNNFALSLIWKQAPRAHRGFLIEISSNGKMRSPFVTSFEYTT
jgi:hypothetical protein